MVAGKMVAEKSPKFEAVLRVDSIDGNLLHVTLIGSRVLCDSINDPAEEVVFLNTTRIATFIVKAEIFPWLVRTLCFDHVEIPTLRGATTDIAKMLRDVRKRYQNG